MEICRLVSVNDLLTEIQKITGNILHRIIFIFELKYQNFRFKDIFRTFLGFIWVKN